MTSAWVAHSASAARGFVLATAWLLLFSSPARPQKFEFAYVTIAHGVSVINTATNQVTATIPDDGNPMGGLGIAVTPDGTLAYVGSCLGNLAPPCTVSVINTATNAVIAAVPIGTFPRGIAVTPDGASAYVANAGVVSVIDTATNTVTAVIQRGAADFPVGVAVSPNGTFIYVTNVDRNDVTVIDTATNTVITSIPAGSCPLSIAITPNGAFAYVANIGSDCAGTGSISVIDTTKNAVIATLPDLPMRFPSSSVAITPDGGTAYVTSCSSGVCVVDTSTNTVTATFATSPPPSGGVAFSLDGRSAYVACGGPGTDACVVDTATRTVTATVPVPGWSVGVAIASVPLFSLDYFKCYTAKTAPGAVKFLKRTVALADEFESKNTSVVKPVSICTPVGVNGEAIEDPAAHLECYTIKDVKGQAKFTPRNSLIQGQFDNETLTATKADTLCIPSGVGGQAAALTLPHFKCYKAKTTTGTAKFKPRTVTLTDEFETKNTTVKTPTSICTPVGVNGAAITDSRPHLECYQIKDVKGQAQFSSRNLAVQNEFDTETLSARKADTLCVPSLSSAAP